MLWGVRRGGCSWIEGMAKDELAQLLEGPLMDDWLVAADFDTPEQPWVAHGAIVEHGECNVFVFVTELCR